jgi:CRP-like cAMP-binding protein
LRPGEDHRWVYRVRTGWLARWRPVDDGHQQIISIFLPGDLVGLKCMLMTRQPDGIEALTAATLNSLDQACFRDLATTDPAVGLRVMFQLAEDERRLHNWVVGLGHSNAEARIAAMLLDFRRRLRRLGLVPRNSFNLPMTQQQIGDYAGLTVVHTNRVLRRFREAGIATITRRTAMILDADALERIARPMLDIYDREQAAIGSADPKGFAGLQPEMNEL